MALGGEPKNGDYARYVEELSRSGASGLPSAPSPEATRSPGATSGSASSSASPLSSAPWGNGGTPPAPQSSCPAQSDSDAATLAKTAAKRGVGKVLTVAATVVGLIAARIALQALNSPQAGLDDFMPAVFLAFFAFMLFKAAGDARKPGKPPAGKLPPLKSTYRKDG